MKTRFGQALVFPSKRGRFLVIPRHGPGHVVPPHLVNYRANIAALRRLGVKTVIATSAVGSMNTAFRPGELGTVEQFIDFTKARPSTLSAGVSHPDMTTPYSGEVNGAIARAGRLVGVKVRGGLVYVCAEGPRYETPAEIRMFRMVGGDVVGMTGVPEVVLANEAGMRYASIVVATNWAAGMQERISHGEVSEVMKEGGRAVRKVVEKTINLL